MRAAVSRVLAAARAVLGDARIPRPLRWAAAAALLPIPGPIDEVVLLLLLPVLLVFYRERLQAAWRHAGQ